MSYYRYERFRPPLPRDIPGTNFILIANIATFFLIFLRIFPPFLIYLLISSTTDVWQSPWAFFTYPLVSLPGGPLAFLSFLFSLIWIYFVGGLLERSWGTIRFLVVFFLFSAISAFSLSLGSLLLNAPSVGFGGLFTSLADLTVIWALLEPTAPVLFFIFPMQLRWLAVIVCLMLLFQFGQVHPVLGFFSLGGCLAAYLYMAAIRRRSAAPRYKSYSAVPRTPKTTFSLNPFEWYRRWKFKRRFKKLWGD